MAVPVLLWVVIARASGSVNEIWPSGADRTCLRMLRRSLSFWRNSSILAFKRTPLINQSSGSVRSAVSSASR